MNEEQPIYSVLNSKQCPPCGPGYIYAWQYQNYPSQDACETAGEQSCCSCVTDS